MLALDRLSGDPVEKHLNSWSYTPDGRASSPMLKSGSMDAFERSYLVVVIVCNRASPSSLIQFASFYNGIHLLSVSPLHSILQALLTAHFPRIPVLLAPYADFRSCLIAPFLVAHAHFPSFWAMRIYPYTFSPLFEQLFVNVVIIIQLKAVHQPVNVAWH